MRECILVFRPNRLIEGYRSHRLAAQLIALAGVDTLTGVRRPIPHQKRQCEDDWSRPKDSKNWKSKVDWEAARRLDPLLADENTIRVMSADEEMKKAMGRDAQLAKARADLDGAGVSPP